jgi:2-oxoglutarate ferredoxin oxidoreductase subunit alpha
MKFLKYEKALTPLIEIVSAVGISFTLLYAYKVQLDQKTFTTLLLALYASYEPIKKLGSLNNALKRGLGALDRLEEILQAPVAIIAPQSPSDCFHAAIEAARIAVEYRTPVFILSDGYLANGSEPWLVPDVATLPRFEPDFATGPNHTAADGTEEFWPYLRDPETLARPWAIPGTKGLEHRIGGIEKADGIGTISYDPDNHDKMVRLRQAKIDAVARTIPEIKVDDPSGDAKVLILGWGSTFGPIGAACRLVRTAGGSVAQAHIRHLNPFPSNLGEVLKAYDKVIVPEMNLGQLALLLRAKYLVDIVSYNQVRGMPFKSDELAGVFTDVLESL